MPRIPALIVFPSSCFHGAARSSLEPAGMDEPGSLPGARCVGSGLPCRTRGSKALRRPRLTSWRHCFPCALLPAAVTSSASSDGAEAAHAGLAAAEAAARDVIAGAKRPREEAELERDRRTEADYKAAMLHASAALQKAEGQAPAEAAVAEPERGTGDWSRYQPPSAVLQAVKDRGAAGEKALPPALAARLAARGIIKRGPTAAGGAAAAPAAALDGVAGSAGRSPAAAAGLGEAAQLASAGTSETDVPARAGALPPGWYAALDQRYQTTYYYNPSTGERRWEPPTDPAPPQVRRGAAVWGERRVGALVRARLPYGQPARPAREGRTAALWQSCKRGACPGSGGREQGRGPDRRRPCHTSCSTEPWKLGGSS